MQLQARLVHAESGRRVVEVSARDGQRLIGSALGEGETAEEAEDRALARLQARLQSRPGLDRLPAGSGPSAVSPPPSPPAQPLPPPGPLPPGPALPLVPPLDAGTTPAPTPPAATEPPVDPEDWSGELVHLDRQLQRLGWGRDQEGVFLQRAFGHPSRQRLTTYGDLMAYIRALEGLEPLADPAMVPVPLRRQDLLAQCDALLAQLGWSADQGRTLLGDHFGASSRQSLSDQQLLEFNMLLEGQWLADAGDAGPRDP